MTGFGTTLSPPTTFSCGVIASGSIFGVSGSFNPFEGIRTGYCWSGTSYPGSSNHLTGVSLDFPGGPNLGVSFVGLLPETDALVWCVRTAEGVNSRL